MKIVAAKIYPLGIPFKFTFGHFLMSRSVSDSVVVEVKTDAGVVGYGEGVPRPYVTGETVATSVEHIEKVLLPAIIGIDLKDIDITAQPASKALTHINDCLPNKTSSEVIAWNASRSAVELAVIDAILKTQKKSLGAILPPESETVTYSGVLTSGDIKKTIEGAKRLKQVGFKYIKVKVGVDNDVARIAAVRDIVGPLVSIRLDANGAFNIREAIRFIESVEEYNIASIEQPVKRAEVAALAEVKAHAAIPVMADESIVTREDAELLIENDACDYFNLRISKCGGLYRTLAIAEMSARSGMKIQLGCQVGETAILSAAGRHLAAYLPGTEYIEGSYSTHLLVSDIACEEVVFGAGGRAQLFTGLGLGITPRQELLEKYTTDTITV